MMIRMASRGFVVGMAAIALSACSYFSDKDDDRPKLEGERISVLALQESLEPANAELEMEGLIAPPAWKNAFWPQSGGYPNHSMQNLDLNADALTKLWSVRIGKGKSGSLPLTAQPILVDNIVYAMDSAGKLSAFNAQNGKTIWAIDASNPAEDDSVIGGAMAYSGGAIFVTNGSNEVLSVHPANGQVLWRRNIPAASRAAPTILDGRVFVSTLNNRLLALSAHDGSTLWEYTGIGEVAGVIGAASPAANRDIVVPVFSSGDIVALRVENGSVAWAENLSNVKYGGGISNLSDIKAQPVIDRGLVMAVSYGGKMIAIDERTGTRIWQREIGSANTPWAAGNHVFVLTTDNTLVALGRDNGVIRWVTEIKANDGKTRAYFTGPVLAGGRIFMMGSDGIVIEINPDNGSIIRQWKAGKTISIPPIVANGAMYILDEGGTLSAYQ